MEHRQMGTDGPQIPVLGLGAWPLGGGMGRVDEGTAIDTIHAAIDSGITLIDTAQAYKDSETFLGRALANGYRDRCFLATKASFDFSPQGIRAGMENSLRDLKVDYVDLYQLHRWDDGTPIEAQMETLAQLQAEGKTRFIGVSNYTGAQLEQAYEVAPFQSDQPGYNLFDRHIEADVLPACRKHGIGVLAHSPLAKGLLTGKYTADTVFPPDDERSWLPSFQGESFRTDLDIAGKLEALARDKDLTLVQFAIAWLLRDPVITCVLVGAKAPAQVADYLPAVGVTFSQPELAAIDAAMGLA
ncbi:aldo/keto reductase [Aggregatilinea lenta]|uniref:aldo/keto reductase n=1 Tax=Aggregatilinea lenta TaxID=913108 RepID=UPI000E5BEC5B|nr:aldo/keto reductase [Aggregatilinea lenta]